MNVLTIDRVNPLCTIKIEPIHRIARSPKAIPINPDRLWAVLHDRDPFHIYRRAILA